MGRHELRQFGAIASAARYILIGRENDKLVNCSTIFAFEFINWHCYNLILAIMSTTLAMAAAGMIDRQFR